MHRVQILLAVAAGATLMASACTPARTTLWPYSGDATLDGLLAERAAATCRCLREGTDLPTHRFTTDGCSLNRDEDWVGCCVAHDIEYWCGGSAEDRRRADDRFARCVEKLGHGRTTAASMRLAVRAGGGPESPFPWRWGYGWKRIRGYDDASNPGDESMCLGW
jgi:hypothetical protein